MNANPHPRLKVKRLQSLRTRRLAERAHARVARAIETIGAERCEQRRVLRDGEEQCVGVERTVGHVQTHECGAIWLQHTRLNRLDGEICLA